MEQNRTARASEQGASAVEYGLLVAAIAAVIVIIVFAVGQFTRATFSDTCSSLANGSYTATTTTCPT